MSFRVNQVLPFVTTSRLVRYMMTSLLSLSSNLVLLDLVESTFAAKAMEAAMKMIETGKAKNAEVPVTGLELSQILQIARECLLNFS